MKKLFYTISLLAVLSISVMAQPKAVFSEEKYDFGSIRQGEIVSHEFVLKNEGNEILKIENVKATCGCTAVAPEKKELKPGESTKIGVKFDSNGRRGVQQKYVYVFTNDPERPQSRLAFATKILLEGEMESEVVNPPLFHIKSNEIDFGSVSEGEVKSERITFMNRGKSELEIISVKSSCDCAAVSVSKKKLRPNEVAFLSVRFDSRGKSGALTHTIDLITNDKQHTEVAVTIKANVVKGEKS